MNRTEDTVPGWPKDPQGRSFPPEPWLLEGCMYASAWLVPEVRLPASRLPEGARPVTVLGRALVTTAWAIYEPEGVLAYNEVLSAVRVRTAGRSFTTVLDIWVDNLASIAGARALWSIPKCPAEFETARGEGGRFEAAARTVDGQPIAALSFRRRWAFPGRWRIATSILQRSIGGQYGSEGPTAARAWTRLELGAAIWDFAPDAPFGFLSGRAPFASARLSEMSLRFGGDGKVPRHHRSARQAR